MRQQRPDYDTVGMVMNFCAVNIMEGITLMVTLGSKMARYGSLITFYRNNET